MTRGVILAEVCLRLDDATGGGAIRRLALDDRAEQLPRDDRRVAIVEGTRERPGTTEPARRELAARGHPSLLFAAALRPRGRRGRSAGAASAAAGADFAALRPGFFAAARPRFRPPVFAAAREAGRSTASS